MKRSCAVSALFRPPHPRSGKSFRLCGPQAAAFFRATLLAGYGSSMPVGSVLRLRVPFAFSGSSFPFRSFRAVPRASPPGRRFVPGGSGRAPALAAGCPAVRSRRLDSPDMEVHCPLAVSSGCCAFCVFRVLFPCPFFLRRPAVPAGEGASLRAGVEGPPRLRPASRPSHQGDSLRRIWTFLAHWPDLRLGLSLALSNPGPVTQLGFAAVLSGLCGRTTRAVPLAIGKVLSPCWLRLLSFFANFPGRLASPGMGDGIRRGGSSCWGFASFEVAVDFRCNRSATFVKRNLQEKITRPSFRESLGFPRPPGRPAAPLTTPAGLGHLAPAPQPRGSAFSACRGP